MNVEVFGDRDFIKSVLNSDGIWILMAGKAVFMLEAKNENALPVWVSKDSAQKFLEGLEVQNLSPAFVPLNNFFGAACLGTEGAKFAEVLAAPVHGRVPLVYSVSELRAKLKT
ncbi:DUF2750 domain-containing protein [Microbulbifer harenosus]|uniref:DUF2750 domain-containing protein n=1 Tax=Microbulbifer harenosus TaxID=2576840 RepID=A0ABY2UCZ0_9GAMM|nr:DUF2750 domain-containing protein [Microbulbifer harenosus]TLM72995.1 DUF2750 domain-containing protein [Microbulbifer harenosus]